jgi:hypothetical protein
MESSYRPPTRDEAAAALMGAEASRAEFAGGLVLPSWFTTSIGAASALQIGTAALGVGVESPWAWGALAAGLGVFVVVSVVQLMRFRRRNGVWLDGLVDRVVLGTGVVGSSSYVVALAAAAWAALAERWLLVAVASLAGGLAYALAGRRWLVAYRTEPEEHGRGKSSTAWLVAVSLAAVGGLILLVLER